MSNISQIDQFSLSSQNNTFPASENRKTPTRNSLNPNN